MRLSSQDTERLLAGTYEERERYLQVMNVGEDELGEAVAKREAIKESEWEPRALKVLRYYQGLVVLVGRGYVKDAEALALLAIDELDLDDGTARDLSDLLDQIFGLAAKRCRNEPGI